MIRWPLILVFVALTIVAWGIYGPTLHVGQEAMGNSKWRPFACVGMAYFLVAVIVPLAMMTTRREVGKWTLAGVMWSLLAGAVGAVGALGIIFAFKFGGKPIFVMPIVFGGAPVINTIVTMWLTKSVGKVGPLFLAGVVLVAAGASGVLVFKPKPVKPPAMESVTMAASEESVHESEPSTWWIGTLLSVLVTVACWGCYGPTLHKGQTKMEGSRLRPFLCVGVAYFLIAVIVPVLILVSSSEPGEWTIPGLAWSLGAGVAGAVGALGIIMAFNYGGKPVFVMPLVFGGAPVINTWTSLTKATFGDMQLASPGIMFFASLLGVIVGAVCVLVFAPKGAPKPSEHAEERAPASSS